MKVGDLVRLRDVYNLGAIDHTIGIILAEHDPCPEHTVLTRIGVLWSDGDMVDWEPAHWLEVVSESR
jgi:hypothetical protein